MDTYFENLPDSDPGAILNNSVLRVLLKFVEVSELPKWRLVNKLCNLVACHHIQEIPVGPSIRNDKRMDEFLATMSTRFQPIPFTYFTLALGSLSTMSVERFVEAVAENVYGYSLCDFLPENSWDSENPLFFREEIQQALELHQICPKILLLLSRSAENLKRLILSTELDIQLYPHQLKEFPGSFSCLRKMDIRYLSAVEELQPSNDVLSTVVARAPKLDHLGIDMSYSRSSRFNQSIVELLYGLPRPKPPSLSLEAEINNKDISVLDTLTLRGYDRLTRLYLDISVHEDEANVWDSAVQLLNLQSESLGVLVIACYSRITLQIQIPKLTKLTDLKLYFFENYDSSEETISPVAPFTPDQFPRLQLLDLGDYNCQHRWLGSSILMPKLSHLCITGYHGNIDDETFHINFPNVTNILLYHAPSLQFLEYILTHLARVTYLDLGYVSGGRQALIENELWKLYTGGADQLSKDELFKLWEDGTVTPCEQNPSSNEDGIYDVSSLSNLKNLKELTVWIRTIREFEAFVFMSRPGGLPSLEKLTLGFYPFSLPSSPNYDADDEADLSQLPTVASSVATDIPDLGPPDEDQTTSFKESESLPSEVSTVDSAPNIHVLTEALSDLEEEVGGDADDDDDEDGIEWGDDGGVWIRELTAEEAGIDLRYISILSNYHKNVDLLCQADV